MDDLTFANGFVFNPDQFYCPSYRISPFQTQDISKNLLRNSVECPPSFLSEKFPGKSWTYTSCGKHAISLAIEKLNLQSTDTVTIFTTSGNTYISGCVTREIEKFCNWSMSIENSTAAIFVNHEFGYPYRNLSELKRFGVPIIEDACHSFFANTPSKDIGLVGDFILYSLPKAFPLQLGGVLAFNPSYEISSNVGPDSELGGFLSGVLTYHEPLLDSMKQRRLSVYDGLTERFATLGLSPFFRQLENDVPGVFMFAVEDELLLGSLKQHCWAHGIECSVFYGKKAFFLPSHHCLSEEDQDYFLAVVKRFMKGA